ncbi:MAG: type II toxin-antitoxin system RelE/ParE family toxin [Bacteroidetes bacterium]|nr:type II toxin-antitoxin system RelE/ParE family toxin [Bacteroidota bacterium]
MVYALQIKPSAQKEMAAIQRHEALKINKAILALANNPLPTGSKKLKATENKYRIRIGNYRVIYNIQSNILTILILKIAHRKEAYK